jgi:uncharacterized membrane protein
MQIDGRQYIFLARDGRGHIFVTGCTMLILWLVAVAVLWRIQHPQWVNLMTMGFAQVILGRAAAIAQATQAGFNPYLTVFLACYLDCTIVMIAYPTLIFCYQNLLERRFFKQHMEPIFASARRSMARFRRSKIIGVFAFVWFPFFMTGVVAGSVLGYLLGLRPWVTMATVVLGTLSATVCWVFAYNNLFTWLGSIHRSIPVAATALIILFLAVRRIMLQRKRERNGQNSAAKAR